MTQTLGVVTVVARRPSSLPTQIPTTIEGITGETVARSINATDSEDALKYFPSLQRAQALHRRLRSRRAREPRFGHAEQRALAGVCRRHPAVQSARQRRHLHAALGPGDAGGDRARRRVVRAVLRGLPRQFRRRRGRLRHANARTSSSCARELSTFSEDFQVYGTDGRYSRLAGQRVRTAMRAATSSWWLNFNRLDSDGHPHRLRDQTTQRRHRRQRAASRSAARSRRAIRATRTGGCSARRTPIHTVQDHAKFKFAHDFGDDAASCLHARRLAQRRDARIVELAARRGRRAGVERRGEPRRARLQHRCHRDGTGRIRAHSPDARPVAAQTWPGRVGPRRSTRVSTTTGATKPARPPPHYPLR